MNIENVDFEILVAKLGAKDKFYKIEDLVAILRTHPDDDYTKVLFNNKEIWTTLKQLGFESNRDDILHEISQILSISPMRKDI